VAGGRLGRLLTKDDKEAVVAVVWEKESADAPGLVGADGGAAEDEGPLVAKLPTDDVVGCGTGD
jgi:hypothetical protein